MKSNLTARNASNCSTALRILHPCFRNLIALLAGLSIVSFGTGQSRAADTSKPGSILVYIGTYTGKKSQGIYVSRLDPKTGAMSAPELAVEMINPSWVTLHPGGRFLYAAGEYGPYKAGGSIAGFSIGQDGKLTAINSQDPNGKGPCHLAIDPSARTIVASNYGDGSVSSLQISGEGKLSPSAWVDRHPTLGEKQKPHAHATEFHPAGKFALSCDAGIDRIYVYRVDPATGALTANDPPFASTAANTHPRHLTFSPDGKFCYSINEAGMSVTAFSFDAELGVLREIQTISTLPADFTGKAGSTAELIMHPSGRYLYGSNRGPDSIVGYSIDAQTGKLTLAGHTPTGGSTARGFGIDPTGQWMIVGNQNSDSIIQFKIDQSTGQATPTGTKFELGAPVCFKFLEVKP
jgi:6-phosphogluconolactonase